MRLAAARAWSIWEGATSSLLPNPKREDQFGTPEFALALARIEAHYFVNRGFFEHENQLLDGVERIRHIPAVIVHGRYDVVCPIDTAFELHRRWPEADLRIVPDAGHSAYEPGITAELIAATDRFGARAEHHGSLQLVNAQLVNEGRIVAADVLIRGERIERIGTGAVPAGTTTIDLRGKHLLPGLIDDQVHFREPGLKHKATLATESLAALCGGVTSFIDMPNTQPPIDGSRRARRQAPHRGGDVPRELRLLSRRDQHEPRGDQARRRRGRVRHQGVHGRLDGQHARRRSERRSTASSPRRACRSRRIANTRR